MSGKPANKGQERAAPSDNIDNTTQSSKRTSVDGKRKWSDVTDDKDSVACCKARYAKQQSEANALRQIVAKDGNIYPDCLSLSTHVIEAALKAKTEEKKNDLYRASIQFTLIAQGILSDTDDVQKAKDDLQTNVGLLQASCATAETAEPRAALERLYQRAVKHLDELAAEQAMNRDSETLLKAVLGVTSKPETTDKKSKDIAGLTKILAVAHETVGTHVDVSKIKTELQTTKELLEALLADKSDERHALERLYAAALKYLGKLAVDHDKTDDINRKVGKRPAPSNDEEGHPAAKVLFSGGHTPFVSPNKESLNRILQLYKELKESGAPVPHGALLYVASNPEDIVKQLQPEEVAGLIQSGTIRIVAIPDVGQTQDAFKPRLCVKSAFHHEPVQAVVAPQSGVHKPGAGTTISWFNRVYKHDEVASWAKDQPDRLCTVVLCTKLAQFVNTKEFVTEHFDLAASGQRSRTATKKPCYHPRFLDVCIKNAARTVTWGASLGPL